jgi:hypothetical protein
MLLSITVFALLSLTSLSFGKECPKIVTQNPFDITKVSLFQFINKSNLFSFSMLAFGMKLIEVIFFLKLELDVSMQHIHQTQMEQ